MKIRVEEIKETEKESTFMEEVAEINDALCRVDGSDYQFRAPFPVDVRYYRLGADLLFHGRFAGAVDGSCARCLEGYSFPVGRDFTFVLKPQSETAADAELSEEDLSLSFYQGDEVDLSPLVREAILLSLPTRPLCNDDCRGLCARCGINRNLATCNCQDDWIDPRLEVFRTLTPKR